MYRKVLVAEDDQRYQNILWRENPNEELKTFCLNTVTYGTSSAPFAIRCLNSLSDMAKSEYPDAAKMIKSFFFVDDLLTSADSEADLLKIQSEFKIY